MNKKSSKIILQNILARSPHRSAKVFNHLPNLAPVPAQQVSDEAYLDKTLSNIYCDFLMQDEFRVHSVKSTIVNHETRIFQNYLALQIAQKLKQQFDLQHSLISSINKLNQPNKKQQTYVELQLLVRSMSISQVIKHKKYLIYLFKCLAKKSGRITPQFQQMNECLMVIVSQKFKEAFQEELSENNIQQQSNRLEAIYKAREKTIKGSKKQARQIYQQIFNDAKYDQESRLQALQYLCRSGVQIKDSNFLFSLIIKIKDSMESRDHVFLRHVQKALQQTMADGENSTNKKDYVI